MIAPANAHQNTTTETQPADYNRGFVWSVCLVAALGGLLFGYDWVVISGADIFYEKYFQLTSDAQIGWAKSCALVGCLLGALLSGGLSDRFGRKRLLLFAALLFTVSSIGTGLANGSWCSSFGALSVVRPSDWHRICRRCISRNSRRRTFEGGWWPSIS